MAEHYLSLTRAYILEQLTHLLPSEYYEDDLARVKTDDWFIQRFIGSKEDDKSQNVVKDAGDAVVQLIKFRKVNRIFDIIKGNFFPIELVTNGPHQIDEGVK